MRVIRRSGERGQGLVEFALVLPMLLMVVFAIVEFGVLYQRNVMLTNASREGARVAAVGATTAEIQARVQSVTPGLTPTVTVTNARGLSGTNVQVNTTATVATFTPMGRMMSLVVGRGFRSTVTLSSNTSMRLE